MVFGILSPNLHRGFGAAGGGDLRQNLDDASLANLVFWVKTPMK